MFRYYNLRQRCAALETSLVQLGNGSEVLQLLECCYYCIVLESPQGICTLGNVFMRNNLITYWEIKYLTGITSIVQNNIVYTGNIKKYDIPSGVTSMGSYAIANLSKLESVYVYPQTPPAINGSTFFNPPAGMTIYVPKGTLADYQSAQYWSNYASKMVEFE